MKFFSKNICEKLVTLGLKSESEFYYVIEGDLVRHDVMYLKPGEFLKIADPTTTKLIPAFTILDFLSTEEYARENCMKLWPDDIIGDGRTYQQHSWEFHRHAIIDSPDGIDYVSKIVDGMK